MNLYRLYGLIFFFLNLNVLGQNQEDKIYDAIDVFVAHPSAKTLQKLSKTETDFIVDLMIQLNYDSMVLYLVDMSYGNY